MDKESDFEIPYQSVSPDTVSAEILKPMDYQYRDIRNIEINISQPEFTSVCPMTGLPDFGKISIKYVPCNRIIELKSLKYYLLQYRGVGIFYEHLVNRILDDLVKVLAPKRMEVIGEFSARGGITTSVKADYGINLDR